MITSNYNIFFAKTPLQLFNCIEAKNRFHNNDKNILHYQYQREVDKIQIEALINYDEWDKVFSYQLVPSKRIFYPYYISKQLNTYKNKIQHCYFGAYNSIISYSINLIKPIDFYIVDDGVKTLEISKLISSNTIDKKGLFRLLKDKLLGSSRDYIYQAKFFTIYTEIESYLPNRMIHNDYRFFKEKISKMSTENIIYFIGTNLLENIIKIDKLFEDELQKVIHYYQQREQKFIYILHRYEDIEYMTKLSSKYNFKIVKFNNIIEVELLKDGVVPSEVASFASTAVETINIIYGVPTKIFELDNSILSEKHKEVFNQLYHNFREKGIEVI